MKPHISKKNGRWMVFRDRSRFNGSWVAFQAYAPDDLKSVTRHWEQLTRNLYH